jgi:prolyl-tRNA synthetase
VADLDKLVARADDFNEWYNMVVRRADLADYGPVRGTMIVKPYGWSLWENIQRALDTRFKATGVENAAFPMFIPMSYLAREAAHVEGFAPELAVVTHGGGEELSESLAVRPTSETLIGHTFARWIQSYRDLPMLINLWNSGVRWEMRTKLFLRTLEFYWQEGHTAHATAAEAEERTRQMLDIYTDFAVNEAAIPVIPGEKSELERFAGAERTFTIEAMMGDGRALQSATSHYFGQKFAKAFEIRYLTPENTLEHCWTTSWGLSTRFIGAIIMTHGDDNGLILPPSLAPYQVVIIPIYKDDTQKSAVLAVTARLQQEMAEAGLRLKVDLRENLTPGYKFNDWELRGVPLRVEIGPRDVEQNSVALARRDTPGREGKQFIPQTGLVEVVKARLEEIHAHLLAQATQFRDEHMVDVADYDGFKDAVRTGFARVSWAGSNEDEKRIQEETGATLRCFPLKQSEEPATCFYTGKVTGQVAIFARSY